MIDVEVLAWVAGFIDGEGCVSIYKQRSKSTRLGYIYVGAIDVVNTDIRGLYKLHELFGGSVHKRREVRASDAPVYVWRVANRAAARVAEAILPYLVMKQEQAKLLIALATDKRGTTASHTLSKSALEWRANLYQLSRIFNAKGKNKRALTLVTHPPKSSFIKNDVLPLFKEAGEQNCK